MSGLEAPNGSMTATGTAEHPLTPAPAGAPGSGPLGAGIRPL